MKVEISRLKKEAATRHDELLAITADRQALLKRLDDVRTWKVFCRDRRDIKLSRIMNNIEQIDNCAELCLLLYEVLQWRSDATTTEVTVLNNFNSILTSTSPSLGGSHNSKIMHTDCQV